MESKKDIELKAKSLMESSPQETVILYQKLWNEFNNEFNNWDAFFTLKALRLVDNPNIDFAFQIADKYKEDERVRGLLAWLVFDKCVKKLSRTDLLQNESRINQLVNIVPQKNTRENDDYPCPITISVFKLADAFKENMFNARKVNEWIEKLNPDFLSKKPNRIPNPEHGNGEIASDLEKYYSLRTKALIKLELFEECKALCEKALNDLPQFHFNNDSWFKMRIALCLERLGNMEASEDIFKELLSSRTGSDKWFLYRDVAELYFEQKNYDKAWQYAVDSSFYGNEPHFMIKLFLLQARILFKIQRSDEGGILAKLIAAILKEQGWNNKAEYEQLFKFYNLNIDSVENVNSYLKEAKQFWANERYKGKSLLEGIIVFVHKNGKVGKIKDDNEGVHGFHKKDFRNKIKRLDDLNGATVEFYPMQSYDGKPIAEYIKILKFPEKPDNVELEGKIFLGSIKNIVEFGVFVTLPVVNKDGLLHRSKLPDDMKDVFQNRLSHGEKVKVKVIKVTSKGIELSMIS